MGNVFDLIFNNFFVPLASNNNYCINLAIHYNRKASNSVEPSDD